MAELDEYDKFRKKFNEGFRKITKSEVDDLSPKQRRIYDAIVDNQNIAAVPKGKSRNTLINSSVRLREFDSETFKPVKQPVFRSSKKAMDKRRAEANEYKTDLDFPGASKGYNTKLGINVPKPKPRTAPSEGKAHGGMVHRGRKASSSFEKG
jgi:hypothetical protein